MMIHGNLAPVYRVIEKSQNPKWYLVLASNECDEGKLVVEYVDMTVQKLRKGKQRSRDLPPSHQFL